MSIALELDREAWSIYDAPRRKRGRPLGSRNKPKAKPPKVPRTSDRDSQMIVMRESGMRLEDIGAAFNITRERARQCLAQLGYAELRVSSHDPVKILRTARAPHITDLVSVSREIGVSYEAVQRMVRELEVGPALQRLYRWRRRERARAQSIVTLRAFYAKHGRSPSSAELGFKGGVPVHPDLAGVRDRLNAFKSFRDMFAAAGIPSRPKGTPGRAGLR